MKVLVTGASGFVGKHLCAHLRTCGYEVDTVRRVESDVNRTSRVEGGWEVGWPAGLRRVDLREYTAILHLAAPSEPRLVDESAVDEHTAPLRALLEAASQPGVKCGILFVSSQSANEAAMSAYGVGKWRCEMLLRESSTKHVIIKPGLIVGRSGKGGGLFAKIDNVIRLLPVVPVPDDRRISIQPVVVEDVIRIIEFVLPRIDEFSGRVIGIAGPSRSLPKFVRDACWEGRINRWVLPVPAWLANLALRILGALAPASHFAPERLEALKRSDPIDDRATERLTGVELASFGVPATHWSDGQRLCWEARLISRHLLGAEPTERMIMRYIKAHRQMPHLSATTLGKYKWFGRTRLGIQLLEYLARSESGPLSQKIWLLCYLAEVEPRFAASFFATKRDRLRAWTSLLGAAALTLPALAIRVTVAWVRRRLPPGVAA